MCQSFFPRRSCDTQRAVTLPCAGTRTTTASRGTKKFGWGRASALLPLPLLLLLLLLLLVMAVGDPGGVLRSCRTSAGSCRRSGLLLSRPNAAAATADAFACAVDGEDAKVPVLP